MGFYHFYVGMIVVTILWGFEGFIGVRKFYEAVYGGMKILRLFQKLLPTGYPALKKTGPYEVLL